MREAQREAGRQALQGVDEVLRGRPNKNDPLLAEVTQKLCLFRELLIARLAPGETEAERRLGELNGVISVVAGVHYPMGEAPWDALESGREWLARLVEAAAEPSGP